MARFVSTETLRLEQDNQEKQSGALEKTLNAQALAQYEEARVAQVQRAVVSPPPPDAFRGLRVGPELSIEYEDSQGIPVEGSNPLLRNLSPFMFQIEPPLAFGSDGALVSGAKPGIDVDTFTRAGKTTVSLAQKARANLAQSNIVGMDYTASSPQAYVTPNSPGGPNQHTTPDGEQADATGETASGRLWKPAIADVFTAVDIAMQLSATMNTPPLVLLVNPNNLSLNITKLQQFQDRSRQGYIFHAWGEEQPKLSITAKCGAFMSSGRGVSFASKRDSASWQNLMNAFTIYRNNGYIYDTQGRSNAHHFVGQLSVWYDGWVYYGHMESFNYAYQDSQPNGGVEFTMEFTVSAMTDTAPETTSFVAPMRSPTPSLDRPIARSRGAAGEFSIGLNGLYTQGREVSYTEALQTLIPEDLLQVGDHLAGDDRPRGVQSQETGTDGFQTASAEETEEVKQTERGRSERFV